MTPIEAIEYMSSTGNPVRVTWWEMNRFIKLYKNDMVLFLIKNTPCAAEVDYENTIELFKRLNPEYYTFEKYEH